VAEHGEGHDTRCRCGTHRGAPTDLSTCPHCGAICPWNPASEGDLWTAWCQQHPAVAGSVHALAYLQLGWAVFPVWPCTPGSPGTCTCPAADTCGSPGKHPMTRRGLHDASRDVTQVATWWGRYPHANVGIPAGDNGLAVIDIDPRHGGARSWADITAKFAASGAPIPATVSATTGGGGRHYLFAAPEGGIKSAANAFGHEQPGVDTRGRGGYIVVAPSRHASGGTYLWDQPPPWPQTLAPWPTLLDKLLNADNARPVKERVTSRGDTTNYANTALERECDTVAHCPAGGRNNTLNESAFNLGTLVGAGQLDRERAHAALLVAALTAGLGRREAEATIRSGLDNGTRKPRAAR